MHKSAEIGYRINSIIIARFALGLFVGNWEMNVSASACSCQHVFCSILIPCLIHILISDASAAVSCDIVCIGPTYY